MTKRRWSGFLNFFLLLAVAASVETLAASSPSPQASLKSLKDATHIEFKGLPDWRYDITRRSANGKKHVLVQLEGIKPDEVKNLESLKDGRVLAVEVKEGVNSFALIDFTLGDPAVNVFDYQTESPSNLILDFYKEMPSQEQIDRKVLKKKRSKALAKQDRFFSRSPASDIGPAVDEKPLLTSSISVPVQIKNGIFDGGDQDLKRFKLDSSENKEKSIIRSSQNIYVHFPDLVVGHPYFEEVLQEKPRYELEKENTEENQMVQLIVKFLTDKKSKPAVALRTMKFFNEKYPQSKYSKMIDFLRADIYFKLWQRDHQKPDLETALTRYKDLLNDYPDDPRRFHILMLIGLSYLEVGNYFGALSTFQVGVQTYPDSPYYWPMRMVVAETYRALGKTQDALHEFDEIEKNPKSGIYSSEARYRRGDVFFKAKDYASAINEYKEALRKYPAKWADGPNIFFNLAEALFWQKDYLASLDAFRDFLQRFPSNSYGGYAMTRLGEILDILGGPKQKVHGAYLESFFRFHDSPGAYLAKVHINTERFATMKEKEVEAVRKENGEELPKNLDGIDAFVTLAESDGYLLRKNYEKSRSLLVKYFQSNPSSPYLDIFKSRIVAGLTSEMQEDLEKQNDVGALELYLRNLDKWFLKNNRIDTLFYAARAYEALNVPDDSSHLYLECLKDLQALKPDVLKMKSVFENLPSIDEVNLRLAKVNLDTGEFKKAAEYLAAIKEPAKLSESEQIERSLILAAVAEKQEKPEVAVQALKNLTEKWTGKPELLAEPWLRLGNLFNEMGKQNEAMSYLKKINDAVDKKAEISPKVAREALELEGALYISKKQIPEAIKAYGLVIEKYGDSDSVASVRYKLGKLYYDQKNLREASRVWGPLKDSKGGEMWAKMADEHLSAAQWSQKYNRYLNRAPAGGNP